MNPIKDKLISTFQKIQYDTEMLISNIDFNTKEPHTYNDALIKLRSLLMSRVSKRLKQMNDELHRYNDIEDISLYLDAIASENQEFTDLVSEQIEKAIASENIDDFIYQLKEENGDLFFRLTQKSSPFLESIKDKQVLNRVIDKIESQKQKVFNFIKSKGRAK